MDKVKVFLEDKIVLLFIITVSAFFLYKIKDITLLFFAAFVIASALNPLIEWMSYKISRGFSVLLVYLAGFVLSVIFLIPLVYALAREIRQFIVQIPQITAHMTNFSHSLLLIAKKFHLSNGLSQISSSVTNFGSHIVNSSITMTISFLGGMVILFTLAMIVLYMLVDKNELKGQFLRFFPKNKRERAEIISENISAKVGGFALGQIMSMFAVGILTAIGFALIKLKFSLLLGMITGVLDIIPVAGPIISISLAIIVALSQKPIMIAWVIIIFSLVQWGTNTFLKPYVFGKFLNLHPLIIIFALLVSVNFGVIAVILSPAIAAAVWVLIEELYLKRIEE